MSLRLFREEVGPRGDLSDSARSAKKLLSLKPVNVREAVSGRGRPERRFKALMSLRLFPTNVKTHYVLKNLSTVLVWVKAFAKLQRERSLFGPGLFREESDIEKETGGS